VALHQRARHMLDDDAGNNVGPTTGAKRNNHGDRPRRKGLRPRGTGHSRESENTRCQMQKLTARGFHAVPLGDTGERLAIDCARRPSVRLNASPEDAKCCLNYRTTARRSEDRTGELRDQGLADREPQQPVGKAVGPATVSTQLLDAVASSYTPGTAAGAPFCFGRAVRVRRAFIGKSSLPRARAERPDGTHG
jgi:hypothetical protein